MQDVLGKNTEGKHGVLTEVARYSSLYRNIARQYGSTRDCYRLIFPVIKVTANRFQLRPNQFLTSELTLRQEEPDTYSAFLESRVDWLMTLSVG